MIVNDARRHKSSKKCYNPSIPMEDSSFDIRFKDLKLFKNKLGSKNVFEFKHIKNDVLRVRAKCFSTSYMWLIFYSWCSGKKMYVVNHYEL